MLGESPGSRHGSHRPMVSRRQHVAGGGHGTCAMSAVHGAQGAGCKPSHRGALSLIELGVRAQRLHSHERVREYLRQL